VCYPWFIERFQRFLHFGRNGNSKTINNALKSKFLSLKFVPEYYIGIDWGRKKCGIAVADEENKIATAYSTLLPEELFRAIQELEKKCPIKAVIVGFLEEGENLNKLEGFIKSIKEAGYQVEKEKEDFTSLLAQKNLHQAGLKRVSTIDDAEAARIILQSWLDKKR
jgi:putative Holliday junction resolvase